MSVRAGALLLQEIERLERTAAKLRELVACRTRERDDARAERDHSREVADGFFAKSKTLDAVAREAIERLEAVCALDETDEVTAARLLEIVHPLRLACPERAS